LKREAVKQRKSLSAVIREKVGVSASIPSNDEIKKIMANLDVLARGNAKKIKGRNGVLIIREMRDNAKW
jgi:hypothetical protein